MIKLKKVLAVTLGAALMVGSLAGCGNNSSKSADGGVSAYVPNRPAVILWQLLFLFIWQKISWNYVIQIEVFFLRERFVNAKVQKITQKTLKIRRKILVIP